MATKDNTCGAFSETEACPNGTDFTMICGESGVESPVCAWHKELYQDGGRVVNCKACGTAGAVIADHYWYRPV